MSLPDVERERLETLRRALAPIGGTVIADPAAAGEAGVAVSAVNVVAKTVEAIVVMAASVAAVGNVSAAEALGLVEVVVSFTSLPAMAENTSLQSPS